MHRQMFVTCVSSGRPANVQHVESLFGHVTWIVPSRQVNDYSRAGADSIRGKGNQYNCAQARNGALEAAFEYDLPCLMLDDDPTGKIERFTPGHPGGEAIDFQTAVRDLSGRLALYDLKLAALSHLTNSFYVNRAESLTAIVLGGCLLVLPTDLRFDEELPLNSDVDYALQHEAEYGAALRVNDTVIHFGRNDGVAGGVSEYRDQTLREQTVARLIEKWPHRVYTKEGAPEHPVLRRGRRAMLL